MLGILKGAQLQATVNASGQSFCLPESCLRLWQREHHRPGGQRFYAEWRRPQRRFPDGPARDKGLSLSCRLQPLGTAGLLFHRSGEGLGWNDRRPVAACGRLCLDGGRRRLPGRCVAKKRDCDIDKVKIGTLRHKIDTVIRQNDAPVKWRKKTFISCWELTNSFFTSIH